MDISSYTSNIQSYGAEDGTKVASKNGYGIGVPGSARSVSDLSLLSAKGTEHEFSVQTAVKLAESRQEFNREEREKMVAQMNEFVTSINKGVAFRVDEGSGRDVVTIYETHSGDIIRQFPDEELLVVLRRLAEHTANSGLLAEKV
ncbi:flagellar protein FlaG [Vibrio alginolyticus]|uniref:flagellar protein FlaG n=1 Tax=Vibrio sp. B1FLJ16 TaxID=2751178 RepID=UPI0015F6F09C|nr:flagellar protein FlaG [Vibrio sp. B1FLJ16]CAD7809356.1 flagellar protein FlaG [Vibrio sp. B1FLJ16]CAE6909384.1 flagellar protein FlaG [Vibrio sp. B1FLJ16]